MIEITELDYHQRKLQEQTERDKFFAQARQDIGYYKKLNRTGIKLLEQEAWSRGHANGFDEVKSELIELWSLVDQLDNYRIDTQE